MRRAFFRVDQSPEIGGGHLIRCLALADALRTEGWTCFFATRGDDTARMIEAAGHGALRLEENVDAEAGQLASHGKADLLVVDHYGRDAGLESACRPFCRRILVIDDLADRPHDADVILDQNLGRRGGDYDGLVADGCKRLIGPAFALLRPQFAAARPATLVRRNADSPARRILVQLGMGNREGPIRVALEGILRARPDLHVDLVAGRMTPGLNDIVEDFSGRGLKLHAHVGVSDMAGMMSAADMAVGAGGSGSWERCCLGLPSLVMVLGPDQAPIARALADRGIAAHLGTWPDVTADGVAGALEALAADHGGRGSMARRAARACDGLGARRVALALDARADGTDAYLRPVTREDADILFAWQTHPGSRTYMRNPRPPTREEHEAFMERRAGTGGRPFELLILDGTPAAAVRLEDVPKGLEVSIVVAPGHRGRGVGRIALTQLRRLVPDLPFVADVHPDNEPSLRLFSQCGYTSRDGGLICGPVA